MRAIEATSFAGYGGLQQTERTKPQPAKDRALVRVMAEGEDEKLVRSVVNELVATLREAIV